MFLCHIIKIRAVQVAASHSHLILAIRAGQQLRKKLLKVFLPVFHNSLEHPVFPQAVVEMAVKYISRKIKVKVVLCHPV